MNYKPASLLIIVLCLATISIAQPVTPPGAPGMYSRFNRRVDSLKKELDKFPKPDSSRLKALIQILNQATFVKEREMVMPYCTEAISLARKLKNNKLLSGCMYFIGNLYKGKKIYDSAALFADSGMYFVRNKADAFEQKQFAKCSRFKGQIYATLEDYEGAIPHYLEALKYFDSTKENDKCFLYKDISFAYLNTLNRDKYVEYAERFVRAAEENGTPVILGDAYAHLAKAFLEAGDISRAKKVFEKADSYFSFEKEYSLNSFYYLQKGIYFRLTKEYDSSLVFFQKALMEAEQLQHSESICHTLQELFTTSIMLNKPAEAGEFAARHLQLAQEGHFKAEQMNAWKNLSVVYSMSGNYKEAFVSLENSNRLRDSLTTEENIRQINLLEARYQFEKKQKEILQLQKEKEIQASSLRQKSILNKIFIVAIALLALAGFMGYRNFKNKQQLLKQKEAIQAQQIRELEKDKQLTAASFMMKGQEEERSRLAKDLHDGLGGLLSGVKHSMLNMKENMILTEENTRAFERSVEMIDNSVKELRRVAQNMMPEALAKFGLADAINDFCKVINASGAIRIIYQNFGNADKYEKSVETSVYRIIQELINNAIKHASATEVLVQTVCNTEKISIAVEDNGKGFDTVQLDIYSGAGWKNIRSRVDYLKGSIDINSEPGKGTFVNIELKVV